VLQFAIGVLVLHETMPPARWWGFALVWVALILLTIDGVRTSRSQRLGAARTGDPAVVDPAEVSVEQAAQPAPDDAGAPPATPAR
jgi:chloramphenicol-sensitive protein RarD